MPRCRLFNIGPKIGPLSAPPPFLLLDLIWTPPFQKSWIRPSYSHIAQNIYFAIYLYLLYHVFVSTGSLGGYLTIGIGAFVSIPVILYTVYVLYKHRKRKGSNMEKIAWDSIRTASPRESESMDVQVYFQSSTESQSDDPAGSSSGHNPVDVSFYISGGSDEDTKIDRFTQKPYLPITYGTFDRIVTKPKYPTVPTVWV